MQATQYPELDSIIEKMGAIFNNASNYDLIEVDFSPWGSSPNEQDKFNSVKRAMLQQNVIRFDYVNGQGHRSNTVGGTRKTYFQKQCMVSDGFLSAVSRT